MVVASAATTVQGSLQVLGVEPQLTQFEHVLLSIDLVGQNSASTLRLHVPAPGQKQVDDLLSVKFRDGSVPPAR